MNYFQTAIDYLRSVALPKSERWHHAQYKETHYWKTTPAYYMPWLDRLNRFGYQVGDVSRYPHYVDSLPLSQVLSRFDFVTMPPRPRVVDLGCGPSGIGYSLRHDGTTYCIDPLLDEYRKIPGYRENIFGQLGENKVLVREDGERATVPEPVDLVFCINVLDHTKDPAAVLRNCARLLKGNGFLFLMVDGYANWSPFIVDPLHPHQFTASSLKPLVEASGFEILHFQEVHCVHGGRLQRLFVWLQNLGRRPKTDFSEFFVVARRCSAGGAESQDVATRG